MTRKHDEDPTTIFLMQEAAHKNDVVALQSFLDRHEFTVLSASSALMNAARSGSLECVRLLIPVSDPQKFFNGAIVSAAMSKHYDCVRELLPVSDLESAGVHVLYYALECDWDDVIEGLWEVVDLNKLMQHARTDENSDVMDKIEQKLAHQQKDNMEQELLLITAKKTTTMTKNKI